MKLVFHSYKISLRLFYVYFVSNTPTNMSEGSRNLGNIEAKGRFSMLALSNNISPHNIHSIRNLPFYAQTQSNKLPLRYVFSVVVEDSWASTPNFQPRYSTNKQNSFCVILYFTDKWLCFEIETFWDIIYHTLD